MADVLDELLGSGAPPEELIAQLRRQRTVGQLGALSGDQRIAGLGSNVAKDTMAQATDLRDRRDRSQAREDQQAFARWQQEQAMAGRAADLDFRKQSLAQARALAEAQMANARDIAGLKAARTGPALTPFEKRYQMDVAKDAAQWDSTGKVQAQAALGDIKGAIGALEGKDEVGKSWLAGLPGGDYVRSKFDPKGMAVQQMVNRVTVQNLRDTFGAQFTEREGAQYKELDYDPKLSDAVNLERLKGKLAIIEDNIRRKNQLFGQYRPDDMSDLSEDDVDLMDDDTLIERLIRRAQQER